MAKHLSRVSGATYTTKQLSLTNVGDAVVVNLASRLPRFLGSASSAPEGLGSQIGANLVRD